MIPVWILPLTCARHTIIIKSKISPETNKNETEMSKLQGYVLHYNSSDDFD